MSEFMSKEQIQKVFDDKHYPREESEILVEMFYGFGNLALEEGKKQGAVGELKKLGKFIDDWYSAIDGKRLTEYYAKGLKEKEGV
jgi:hypothetical protein